MDEEQGAADWREWLTELWAKEPVRVVIEGPLGSTSAALYLKQQDGEWGPEAVHTGALDLEGAMDGLWDAYEANLETDEHDEMAARAAISPGDRAYLLAQDGIEADDDDPADER